MGNPLFGNGGMGQNNMFGPFGGMMNFMNQFNQFRQGIQGNPQQMVQNMLQNGQMRRMRGYSDTLWKTGQMLIYL